MPHVDQPPSHMCSEELGLQYQKAVQEKEQAEMRAAELHQAQAWMLGLALTHADCVTRMAGTEGGSTGGD